MSLERRLLRCSSWSSPTTCRRQELSSITFRPVEAAAIGFVLIRLSVGLMLVHRSICPWV
ncbi:unnamed protein product [Citrullus colocynthis]|uniref:Uncharacterized protein n=1 Tax=Citrullus colocynthis TaxID=252529 RepID=A0ABP0YVR0_9ROSI